MSSAAHVTLHTIRRSSITSVNSTTMALDVISLNSGHSNRVHDKGLTMSPKMSPKRMRERKSRSSKQNMRSASRDSNKSVTSKDSKKSIVSKDTKRRKRRKPRKTKDQEFSSSDAGRRDIFSTHKRRGSINNTNTSINYDAEADTNVDPLDSGKTEHTSNLTEHSRTIIIGLENCGTCNEDEEEIKPSEDDGVVSPGGEFKIKPSESDEIVSPGGEFRFQSLLKQWKTREKEQKNKTKAIFNDRLKASYLSEDEDHSCFGGVMKHWKKKYVMSGIETSHKTEVVVDDDHSDVSSLGDSLRDGLRWGYESDSRFDFGFDARRDIVIMASPRSTKKKKKKSKKKRGQEASKSQMKTTMTPMKTKKKHSDSKTSKKKTRSSEKAFATFDAAMDAARSALDGSVVTMDESVATMDTTDSKKKKKKSKSKKKIKGKKSSKKNLDTKEISSESTETETPILSDDEGSKGSYLPTWLSPEERAMRTPKPKLPVKKDPPQEMPFVPNLL